MTWTLDKICELTTRPELLNALHACRPGHPWNKTAVSPWRNASFLAAQRSSYEIPETALEWLRSMANKESRDGVAVRNAQAAHANRKATTP